MQPHITTAGVDINTESGQVISFSETTTRRPAVVKESAPDVRRYEETMAHGLCVAKSGMLLSPYVFRLVKEDAAHLSLSVLGVAELTICLPAHELRRLASDLLDAAFDIEQNPA